MSADAHGWKSGLVWRSEANRYAVTLDWRGVWFYARGYGISLWVPNVVRRHTGPKPRWHLHHVRSRCRWGHVCITTPRRTIHLPAKRNAR